MDEPLDLKNKILAWLADEFNVSVKSLPKNAPLDWAIKAETQAPVKVALVIQKPRGRDVVAVTIGIALSQKHREALSKLGPGAREEFAVSLVRDLIALCPHCRVIAQPNPRDLQTILISRELYSDSLTRQSLIDASVTLVNMFLVTVLKLNQLSQTVRAPRGVDEGYM
ncbi:conserved hypothetical protein [Aeropyrum pernix K1]|uniref:DUF2299 domain-containing protein n=1 Tax=Aeropyrum pernix (strain ATCC 700893 / DSM 11879 / JCM 9820 / NBRC 100138 / K1) TaxID=272557 RepID=Q9YB98_AERPE|nr:DUF2299 domain-containing protein [Aeropyrum pernix]BAA80700.1 conserved hypothetical protein [Aeropyrum pernix K1]